MESLGPLYPRLWQCFDGLSPHARAMPVTQNLGGSDQGLPSRSFGISPLDLIELFFGEAGFQSLLSGDLALTTK